MDDSVYRVSSCREWIGIALLPDLIHVMKKSEYSGQFGDYSSYSEEYDALSDDSEESSDEFSEQEEEL